MNAVQQQGQTPRKTQRCCVNAHLSQFTWPKQLRYKKGEKKMVKKKKKTTHMHTQTQARCVDCWLKLNQVGQRSASVVPNQPQGPKCSITERGRPAPWAPLWPTVARELHAHASPRSQLQCTAVGTAAACAHASRPQTLAVARQNR